MDTEAVDDGIADKEERVQVLLSVLQIRHPLRKGNIIGGQENMRKRIAEPMLKSWEDVNDTLKDIAECETEIDKIEADMNLAIARIKEEADHAAKDYRERIKKGEVLVKEFTTANKPDLNGKSRSMTFGTVGFRASSKLILPKALGNVIEALRRNRMDDCITVKESVNKDMLKSYSEDMIIMVGGSVRKEDTFWYETKKDVVAKA